MILNKWKMWNQQKKRLDVLKNQQTLFEQNNDMLKDLNQLRYEVLTKLDVLLEDKEMVNIISTDMLSKEDAKEIINVVIEEVSKIYPNDGTVKQSNKDVVLGNNIPPFTYGGLNFDLLPEGVFMLTAKNKEVFTKKDGKWYIVEEYKIISNFSKGETIKKLEGFRDSIS